MLQSQAEIRILIVAVYASVRAGLRALLQDAPGLCVVGEAAGREGDVARWLAEGNGGRSSRPDVVLLDAAGETEDALERTLDALSLVRDGEEAAVAVSPLVLVVLGDRADEDAPRLAEAAPLLSGWAYLHREAEGPQIAGAVRAAASGLFVFDRDSLMTASDAVLLPQPPPEEWEARPPSPADLAPDEETLTPRETEVLQLMAQGLPNKIIATRLDISLHTAKFHVAQILAKLDAASRTEAVTIGARRGYVVL